MKMNLDAGIEYQDRDCSFRLTRSKGEQTFWVDVSVDFDAKKLAIEESNITVTNWQSIETIKMYSELVAEAVKIAEQKLNG